MKRTLFEQQRHVLMSEIHTVRKEIFHVSTRLINVSIEYGICVTKFKQIESESRGNHRCRNTCIALITIIDTDMIQQVGGDFAKVEDLWAQFENFMGPQDNNINSEVNQQEEHKS